MYQEKNWVRDSNKGKVEIRNDVSDSVYRRKYRCQRVLKTSNSTNAIFRKKVTKSQRLGRLRLRGPPPHFCVLVVGNGGNGRRRNGEFIEHDDLCVYYVAFTRLYPPTRTTNIAHL